MHPRRKPARPEILAALITLLLLLPSISLVFDLAEPLWSRKPAGPGLAGVVAPRETELRPSWQAWFSGELQQHVTAWFTEHLGPARRMLIRLTDGIYYVAFRKSLATNAQIVIGRDRVLYQQIYIDDACGRGGHVDPAVLERALDAARRALAERGIAFAFLISPSKAAIYPQFIPSAECGGLSRDRGYDRLRPLLAAGSEPIVDGHAVTAAFVASHPWPAFDRDGIHWNHLCALMSIRPLIALLEGQLRRPLVHLRLERVDVDDHPTGLDADLGHLLNLPFPLHPYPVPHAVIGREPGGKPVRVLFVGSSFLWGLLEVLVHNGAIADSSAYYYYSRVIRVDGRYHGPMEGFKEDAALAGPADLGRTIGQVDAVVLEVNEAFLDAGYVMRFLDDVARLPAASPSSVAGDR